MMPVSGIPLNDRVSGSEPSELSLLGLAVPILRHRLLVATVTATVVVAAVGATLLRTRSFSSSASFIPQSRTPQSNLAGLAAQFGLGAPAVDVSRSPAFYVDLLQTRMILRKIVETPFSVASEDGHLTQTLVDLYGKEGQSIVDKREAAISRLKASISSSVVQRTGVVNLSVSARSPELAAQIAAQLLTEVNRFNMETRQTQATAERQFTERRLEEVQSELRDAEDRLQFFLQHNRDFRNSPELSFQQDRLAREVAMRQQVYTTLSQAYEQAKIDEVRDTPVITILERPEIPVRPDPRGLLKKGLLALIAGGIAGVFLAYVKESVLGPGAKNSQDYAMFTQLARQAWADLKRGPAAVSGIFRRPARHL